MTDDFDELLEDVSELETQISSNKPNTQASGKSNPTSNHSDGMAIALETAKTAQDAAIKSQEVAQTNLKLAEELKAQERELSEANFNWRQSFRSSVATLNNAKGQFVIMMAVTLITSMIALGVMSFLYYSIQQKEQQMKGEILDLLQNEQSLFNKDMNVKVDQITAMMEMVQYQVEQALLKDAANQESMPSAAENENAIDLNLANETDELSHGATPSETTEMAHEQHNTEAHEQPHQLTETAHTPADAVHSNDKVMDEHTPSQTAMHTTETSDNHFATELHKLESNFTSAFKTLADRQIEILQKLTALEKAVHQPATSKVSEHHSPAQPVAQPKETNQVAELTAEQTKQLKNIHWWVSQQDKAIKRIEQSLKSAPKQNPTDEVSSRLNTIDQQMKQMHTQQTLIETQLEKLQTNVKQLVDKSNASYIYKAKDELVPKP